MQGKSDRPRLHGHSLKALSPLKTEPIQPVQTSKMRSVIFATNTFHPQAHKLANSDARGIRYHILVYRVLYCMVQRKKLAVMKEKS